MSRKYDRYWEMNQVVDCVNGKEKTVPVFKCTECNATTVPDDGHSGSPDTHKCSPKCRCNLSEWSSSKKTRAFARNFDRIFPHAPGAGV